MGSPGRGGTSPLTHRWKPLLLLHLVLVAFHVSTDTSEVVSDEACRDEYPNCAARLALLQHDDCSGRPDLLVNCKRSCNVCATAAAAAGSTGTAGEEVPICKDDNELCDEWATNGECVEIGEQCKKACGFCEGEDDAPAKRKNKEKKGKRPGSERHDLVPDSECHDHHDSCEAWAAIRWCSKDPIFMQSMCPESCYMCAAARKPVLRRVEAFQSIFSGEAIDLQQGTDRDRFIPGVDPVFKLSRADNADLLIESAEVLGVSYGRHGGVQQNRLRKYSIESVWEDVEELKSVPGLGTLCVDWHPSCAVWFANGDCLENPHDMAHMCQASCGMCRGEWDEWETFAMEPEVQQWFSGPHEGAAAALSAAPTDGGQQEDSAVRFDWAEDREASSADEQPVSGSHSSHGHGAHAKKGQPRKVPAREAEATPPVAQQERLDYCQDTKPEQCKGKGHTLCSQHASDMAANCRETCGLCQRTRDYHPLPERDLVDGGRTYPMLGLSINEMGNQTQLLVEAAIVSGVTRFEADLGRSSPARLDLLGRAIRASGVPRRAVYISLIVDPEGYGTIVRRVVEALKAMHTAYTDMALLKQANQTFPVLLLSWQALEKLHSIRAVHALGAADGELSYTGFIRRRTSVPFSLMQRSMDPFLPDQRAVDTAHLRGLTYVGLNLLGSRWLADGAVSGLPTMNNTALQALSKRRQRSVALVCVRWALQRGLALTLSMAEITEADIPSLMGAFAFSLKDRDMAVVDSLEKVNPSKPQAAGKQQQQRPGHQQQQQQEEQQEQEPLQQPLQQQQRKQPPQQQQHRLGHQQQQQQQHQKQTTGGGQQRAAPLQQPQPPAIKRVPAGQQAAARQGDSGGGKGDSGKAVQKPGPGARGRPGGSKAGHGGHSR